MIMEAIDVFAGASVEQMDFQTEVLSGHAESLDARVGHRLVAVAGTRVARWVRLAYVVGQSHEERYVYIVGWSSPDAQQPEIREVASEAAARLELLQMLKRQTRTMDPDDSNAPPGET